MAKEKAIVLYSGGLDSRLTIKIMEERGYEVIALHFNLPFGCGCCDFGCNFKFTQMSGVNFKIFDASKGKLLKEYLDVIKKGKHGRGSGYNSCKDCKIWMFKHAKKYADTKNIKIIATGEVIGQRPMSQTSQAMKIIDKELGFELTRPLIELGLKGRSRVKQIAIAKKYKIRYPNPAGGCLLCEKALKKRFKVLLKNNLVNEETLPLVNIGRHFYLEIPSGISKSNSSKNKNNVIEKKLNKIEKNKVWFVVARDENEGRVIETFKGNFIEGVKAKPSVYYSKAKGRRSTYPKLGNKGAKKFAQELQEDFKKGGEKRYMREKL